jgi:hypothetical protein
MDRRNKIEAAERQARELVHHVGAFVPQVSTWMLNRLINGRQDVDARSRYLRALADVPGHPLADEATAQQAREFLGSL